MKVDFKKTLDGYKAKHNEFRVVDIPDQQYLAVDGCGDPNTSPRYRSALESIYPLAYTIKFASKTELGCDYVVMPLEAQWWSANMADFTTARDKSKWSWTVLMMVPDWIEPAMVVLAKEKVAGKHSGIDLDQVELRALAEGMCVQTLHIGSYDDEGPILQHMHDIFIPQNGLEMTGKHHEIYMGDPRKVAPEKLRTILRQPVAKVGDRA